MIKEIRELSIDELGTVSGGGGLSFGQMFLPSILTKQTTSNPAPTPTGPTTSTTPKSASFDPVAVRF